jgi:hypothetical protein
VAQPRSDSAKEFLNGWNWELTYLVIKFFKLIESKGDELYFFLNDQIERWTTSLNLEVDLNEWKATHFIKV